MVEDKWIECSPFEYKGYIVDGYKVKARPNEEDEMAINVDIQYRCCSESVVLDLVVNKNS